MPIKNPESTFEAYTEWLTYDTEKLDTSLENYTCYSFPAIFIAFL